MKKNILKKFSFIFLVNIALLLIFSNSNVKATEGTELNGLFDPNEIILEYDIKTNTTKEVNMQEIEKKLQAKKYLNQINKFQPEITIKNVSSSESVQRVTNTTVTPYKMTCKVLFKDKDNKSHGASAALVAPNLALTAAHCVFDKDNNFEPYKNWTAYPAYNNGNSYNNLSAGWDKVYYSKSWKESSGNYNYDWALCVLQKDLGNTVGYHKVATYSSNNSMKDIRVELLGYPGDEVFDGLDQYVSSGEITSVSDYSFRASFWTIGGFSGGPVIRTTDDRIIGVGSRNRTCWCGKCKNYTKYGKHYQ